MESYIFFSEYQKTVKRDILQCLSLPRKSFRILMRIKDHCWRIRKNISDRQSILFIDNGLRSDGDNIKICNLIILKSFLL